MPLTRGAKPVQYLSIVPRQEQATAPTDSFRHATRATFLKRETPLRGSLLFLRDLEDPAGVDRIRSKAVERLDLRIPAAVVKIPFRNRTPALPRHDRWDSCTTALCAVGIPSTERLAFCRKRRYNVQYILY